MSTFKHIIDELGADCPFSVNPICHPKAKMRVFMKFDTGEVVIACDHCEEPRMVFPINSMKKVQVKLPNGESI